MNTHTEFFQQTRDDITDSEEAEIIQFVEEIVSQLKIVRESLKSNDKEATFILGKTGSCKSTLANILGGVKLTFQNKRTRCHFSGEALKSSIGHERQACTSLPVRVVDDSTGLVLQDIGGFFDTRGTHLEVLISSSLKVLVEATERFKVILTLEWNLFEGRKGDLESIMNIMLEIFPETKTLIDKLFVVVAKVPTEITMEDMLMEFQDVADSMDNKDIREIFYALAENEDKSYLFKKPMKLESWDGNLIREEILAKLERIPYADNRTINIAFSSTAKLQIRKTVDKIIQKLGCEINSICNKVGEICQAKILVAASFKDLKSFLDSVMSIVNAKLEGWWREDTQDIKRRFEELISFLEEVNKMACCYKLGRIDKEKIKKLVEYLEVLSEISHEIGIKSVNFRTWQQKFKFLKNEIANLTKFNAPSFPSSDSIRITGVVLSLAQLAGYLALGTIKTVEIYCLSVLFLDHNIQCRGANVVIICPLWKICGSQRIIDLTGHDAVILPRRNNFDGLPGQSGEIGGSLFGISNTIQNASSLTIKVNGGNGAPGEDGEDGWEGEWGLEKSGLVQRRDKKALVSRVPVTDSTIIVRDFLTLNGRIKEVYEWKGFPGKPGKRGGRGGPGGLGGKPGEVRLISSSTRRHQQVKIEKKAGQDGSYGKPGKDGKQGMTECCRGVYVIEYVLPEYRGKYKNLKNYSKSKMVSHTFPRIIRYAPHIASIAIHLGAPILSPLLLIGQLAVSAHLAIACTGWKEKPTYFFERVQSNMIYLVNPRETPKPILEDEGESTWPFDEKKVNQRYDEEYLSYANESSHFRFQKLTW